LPRLETERLVLRVPGPEDAEEVLAYQVRNRAHLAESGPLREEGFFTLESAEGRGLEARRQYLEDRSACFGLWSREAPRGRVLGTAALTQISRGPAQRCSLGYGLDQEAVGRGYMHEGLEAIIAHAFGALGLHRIEASYVPTNTRSGRVLERLGFQIEGHVRAYVCLNGVWRDHVLTGLINPAHEAPSQG